jgi:hypothetical protein
MKMIKESNYMYVLRMRTTHRYSHVRSSSLKQHQRQQEAAPHMGSDIKEERERERERERARGRGRERVIQVLLRGSSVDSTVHNSTYCRQYIV